MKCPACKAELIPYKKLRLETLDEHISNPNGEISIKQAVCCSNKECQTIGTKGPIVFWNEDVFNMGGELYVSHEYDYPLHTRIKYIDNNNAPFGSFERQSNVECRKHDEDRLLFTIPKWFFMLKGWKVYLKWNYKSNEDGDILQRRPHLEWITDKGIHHLWGTSMLSFSLRGTYRDWKNYKKNQCKWSLNHLQDSVKERGMRNPQWWRKVNAFVARLALKNLHIPLDNQPQY